MVVEVNGTIVGEQRSESFVRERVRMAAIGAEDLYIFLQIFLTEIFPEQRQVPFHISGESFGVCLKHSIERMELTCH